MRSGKCRQNSNLLITYLFFTFVREECGGGVAEVTKMAFSGKRPSLWRGQHNPLKF